MKKPLIYLSAALLFSFSGTLQAQSSKATIDQAEVTRLISTLADDDMEGRQTFTPGIEKAATFIASEFEKVGLEYLDGLNGYQQKFAMYALTPKSVSVSLNGAEIAAENAMTMVNAKDYAWNGTEGMTVVNLEKGANFRQEFGKINGMDGKVLVLVDKSHAGNFKRYRDFFSRGSQVMELDAENGVIMILTDATSAKSISIKASNNVESKPLANVAGKITGKRANEIVLFSAHYDHLGVRENGEDKIWNGANDDASGTSAVMTLAKYFKDMGTQPERTIMFVAFTAEEVGGFGSQYFSKQLNPDEIVAMFNIEMIGKPAVSGPNTAWITGFDQSDFGKLLQKAVEGSEYEFYADPYPAQNLFYRSDNATLARLGVPAHTISTTPIDVDPDYHKASDEVSTLDMEHTTNTIKAISAAAVRIISGKDTPTRVDPTGLR